MGETVANVAALLRAERPVAPVYCIYPQVYLETTRAFVAGFPGRVLYAVKANDDPRVIGLIHRGGVDHFDCASVPEIARVREVCPDGTCYFMVPVRLRGAARAAQDRFGVKHFMVDHSSGLEPLKTEIKIDQSVVFARMAVSHPSALQNLSSKFGAPPEEIPALLRAIGDAGAEPALAFNVGSSVTSPEAYRHAISAAAEILSRLDFKLPLIDLGGGFPLSYPGFPVPPLAEYFAAIREAATGLPLAEGGAILGEPGRALAAPGLSAVVEVLQRKANRLYLNDGKYGIFWELRFKGHERYPVRSYRGGEPLEGPTEQFTLYGPTCDATDVLPGSVALPAAIRAGDHLEFGRLGAYSLSGRTNFNGHYSDAIVTVTDPDARPPAG